ncbi:phosphoribosyl-ATP diphosphatase [Candidatus Pacearchaeota archaeon]|nr:phosphoribosyl-ATP diphosphatase [Candidatus Pacearchaeota archaeon]
MPIVFIVPKNSGLGFCRDIAKEKFGELRQLVVRGEDVPKCTSEMLSIKKDTLGITGEDLFLDYKLKNPESEVEIIEKILWMDKSAIFGKPAFCLLGPKGRSIKDLPKKVKICANKKYKNIVKKYLVKLKSNFKLECEVIYLSGATEEAYNEGICDLVLEIVYSGKSINEYDLEVYEKITESDIVIIGKKRLTVPKNLDFKKMGGLIPTIIKDESGNILMLAYSSKESLNLAVKRRQGIYYSRSRKKIWIKGETSGNTQKLIRVLTDCDRDSLVFIIRQRGVSCHTGEYSCFREKQKFDFEKLYQIIKERELDENGESFTKKLLKDTRLLDSKIIEEANEVITSKNRFELTWEIADIMYFLLVKMASEKIKLKNVFEELEGRNRNK